MRTTCAAHRVILQKSCRAAGVAGTKVVGVVKPTKVTDNVVTVVVTRPSMWRHGRSS
ncbi:hypothetical protein C770_GR4pB185 (plasmid) [Sinorhizobium meliloti GR4]|nr:hypothetical protein C770_GR4pB185 [Sinorhizobium meliloti GR4]